MAAGPAGSVLGQFLWYYEEKHPAQKGKEYHTFMTKTWIIALCSIICSKMQL